jgi:hypothetical protein
MAGKSSSSRKEIADLIKATEQHRVRLQETWKKVENLDAAIESAREMQKKGKSRHSAGRTKK